jgi:hypothetical protein
MTSQKAIHLNLGMIHVLYWNNKNANLHRLILRLFFLSPFYLTTDLLLLHFAYVSVYSRIRGIRLQLQLRYALASGQFTVDLGSKQSGTPSSRPSREKGG